MYFYFSSGYPAAIKLNGLYFGIITDSVKACDIKTEDNPFIEICPLSSGEKGVNFLLTEHFLSSPPEGVSVTDLKGGYLIKFNASHRGGQFGITAQEKFRDAVVTVYNYADISCFNSRIEYYLSRGIAFSRKTSYNRRLIIYIFGKL